MPEDRPTQLYDTRSGSGTRYVEYAISAMGVQLARSPILYSGSDLKIAKNVVLSREGKAGGLTKRPGLRPISDMSHPTDGRAIHGSVVVPFTDTQDIPVRLYHPTDDSVVSIMKLAEWSSDFRERYALKLAAASATQIYLASNDYTPGTDPPSLHVSLGATSVPVYTIRGSVTPYFITCMKAIEILSDTYIYTGITTINGNDSYISVFRYNTSTGDIDSIGDRQGPFTNKITAVTDIVLRKDNPFILTYTTGEVNSAYELKGDVWSPFSFNIDNASPISMATGADGLLYVGCTNTANNDVSAKLLSLSVDNTVVEVESAEVDSGWSAFLSVINYEDRIYAALYKENSLSITIGLIEDDGWQEDVVVRGLDADGAAVTELWPAAQYVGQAAVINRGLHYVLPSSTANGAVIRKLDGEWSVVESDDDFRGPIVGILDD